MKNHLLSPTQIAAQKRFEHCKTQILARLGDSRQSGAKAHKATGAGREKSKPRPWMVALQIVMRPNFSVEPSTTIESWKSHRPDASDSQQVLPTPSKDPHVEKE